MSIEPRDYQKAFLNSFKRINANSTFGKYGNLRMKLMLPMPPLAFDIEAKPDAVVVMDSQTQLIEFKTRPMTPKTRRALQQQMDLYVAMAFKKEGVRGPVQTPVSKVNTDARRARKDQIRARGGKL